MAKIASYQKIEQHLFQRIGNTMKWIWVMVAILTNAPFPAAAVDIVAHRGASADAPENTLPAFKLAWERGADVVEGDFLMTSDEKIVCIHDKKTARLASENLSVTSSTYEQLKKLDVGSWKDPKWKGTKIPTLAEVVAGLPKEKGRIFIEIKDSVRIVKPLAAELKKIGVPTSRLAIICFNEAVVADCKATMPEVDVHWLLSAKTYKKKGIAGVLETVKRLGADGIDIQASKAITPELGEALRKNGLQFHCWTVNDVPLARYMMEMGVDSITTDRPSFLRRWALTTEGRVLQYFSFDEEKNDSVGIKGQALSNKVLKSGKPLPASGTVALWYRPTKWHNYQTVFDSTSDPDDWELWIDKNAQIGFRTTRKDLRITHRLHPVATVDQWQHIAVTWDDGVVRLYVNGAPVVKAERQLPSPPSGDFCLGGGNAGNVRGTGSWDEVVVLGTVLSAPEVKTLMLDGVNNLPGNK